MAESEPNSSYIQDDITVLDGLEPVKRRCSPLEIDLTSENANGAEAASAGRMENTRSNEGKATR